MQLGGERREAHLTVVDSFGFHVDVAFRPALRQPVGFGDFTFLFVALEPVVGVLVEEYNHHVGLRTPRGVVAHAVSFGNEGYSLAVGCPAWLGIEISAAGDVGYAAVGYFENGDVGVRVAAVDYLQGNPFAVGAPAVMEAAVAVQIGGAVGESTHVLAFEVHHGKFVAVEDECQLLAVGRYARDGALVAVGGEHAFGVDNGGVHELVFRTAAAGCGPVDVVASVAFRSEIESAVVAPGDVAFGFRGVGNLFGCAVVGGCHIHVAAVYESHVLAVGRYHRSAGSACRRYAFCLVGEVGVDVHIHFCRTSSGTECVDVAVLHEGEGAVGGTA